MPRLTGNKANVDRCQAKARCITRDKTGHFILIRVSLAGK